MLLLHGGPFSSLFLQKRIPISKWLFRLSFSPSFLGWFFLRRKIYPAHFSLKPKLNQSFLAISTPKWGRKNL